MVKRIFPILIQMIVIILASLPNAKSETKVNISALNITVIPVIKLPDCLSDSDCSFKGYCDKTSGKCNCNTGYDTYISPDIVGKVTNRTENKISLDMNTTMSNATIFYQPINIGLNDIKFCNYEMKNQLTALLLSAILGFGSEHFYMERYKVAVAKIFFTLLCCVMNLVFFVIYKCMKKGKETISFIGPFEAFYLMCGCMYMVFWTIYDCYYIGINDMVDGYGMPLLGWNETRSG